MSGLLQRHNEAHSAAAGRSTTYAAPVLSAPSCPHRGAIGSDGQHCSNLMNSDSDSDGEGGLGLGGFLWGNVGRNDELEVDYLDEVRPGARQQQQRARSSALLLRSNPPALTLDALRAAAPACYRAPSRRWAQSTSRSRPTRRCRCALPVGRVAQRGAAACGEQQHVALTQRCMVTCIPPHTEPAVGQVGQRSRRLVVCSLRQRRRRRVVRRRLR